MARSPVDDTEDFVAMGREMKIHPAARVHHCSGFFLARVDEPG
jgi:hypothetical protein